MTDRIQSLCDKAGVKVSPVRSLVMRVLLQAESPGRSLPQSTDL